MKRLETEDARARLATINLEQPVLLTIENGYARAAATLATFDPSALRSADFASPVADRDAVLRACAPVAGGEVALRDDVRIELLGALVTGRGPTALIDARVANDPTPSALQDALDRWLLGPPVTPGELEDFDADTARAWLRVQCWLDGALPGPSRAALLGRLALAELLEPLERLADGFFGREQELARLRGYAAAPIAEPQTPLMLYGRGGVGKSSLVGTFLLELAHADTRARIAWAYIDYDRRMLNARSPIALLAELVRQIAAQHPVHRPMSARLQRMFAEHSREHDRLGDALPVPAIAATARWLTEVAADRPVLVVLDTFEEVQYRGLAATQRVWDVMRLLRTDCANVRPLFVSRAPFAPGVHAARGTLDSTARAIERGLEVLELGGLSVEGAQRFLRAQLATDYLDTSLADIVAYVDRSPLSLLLCAEVIRRDPFEPGAFAQLASRQRIVGSLQRSYVQGFLYRRILDHLHRRDATLARLAHASLAIRRITPEVIVEVLSPACDLGIDSVERATQLLFELAREVAFVEDIGESPGTCLRHRRELRAALGDALVHSLGKDTLLTVHDRAVSYYMRRTGPVDAEETRYHRRALADPVLVGDAVRVFDETRANGSKPAQPASEPVAPKPWGTDDGWPDDQDDYGLPTRSPNNNPVAPGVPVAPIEPGTEPVLDPGTQPSSDQVGVDGIAASALAARVEALLAASEVDGALQLLDEYRPDPPGWQLALLTARALARRGDRRAAWPWLNEHVLDAIDAREHSAALTDAIILAADVHEDRSVAINLLTGALVRASFADIDALRLHLRLLSVVDEAGRAQRRQSALAASALVNRRQLAERPTLVRELAGQLGAYDPSLLQVALERVGMGRPSAIQLGAVADGLRAWHAQLRERSEGAPTIAEAVALEQFEGSERQRWQHFVYSEGRELDRALLALAYRFLDTWTEAETLHQSLARIYREWRQEAPLVPGVHVGGTRATNPGSGPIAPTRVQSLAALRDVLIDVYPTARDVRRVAAAVNLSMDSLASAGRSHARLWFQLLGAAERADKLAELLAHVAADSRATGYRALIHDASGAFSDRARGDLGNE